MRTTDILLNILIVCLLTILTQIGGIVFLFSIPLFKLISHRVKARLTAFALQTAAFAAIYLLFTFTLVPFLAKPLGRVPMPIRGNGTLSPLTYLTVLLNRHYVRRELWKTMELASRRFSETYPDTKILYLDANFPFFNGFPLLPHLSHNDGKKLDLAFFYIDAHSGKSSNDAPSWFGYGACEKPRPGEEDRPAQCAEKGYWQYNLLEKLIAKNAQQGFTFDEKRTAHFIRLLAKAPEINKIFIEPHLKQRLGLGNLAKIRFHGCQAVRHDDHLHIQL